MEFNPDRRKIIKGIGALSLAILPPLPQCNKQEASFTAQYKYAKYANSDGLDVWLAAMSRMRLDTATLIVALKKESFGLLTVDNDYYGELNVKRNPDFKFRFKIEPQRDPSRLAIILGVGRNDYGGYADFQQRITPPLSIEDQLLVMNWNQFKLDSNWTIGGHSLPKP